MADPPQPEGEAQRSRAQRGSAPPGLLYYQDAALRSFEATVAEVLPDGVVLDRTAFFPGGGGQDPDAGTLDGKSVARAEMRRGKVVHLLERPGDAAGFRQGQKVRGEVDWARRSELMRAHSGEHLLVGRLLEVEPKLELVKVHLTTGSKSIFVRGPVTWDVAREAARRANQRIREGHAVVPRFVSEEEAKREAALRIKWERLEGIDEYRIVAMGDFDRSACSGVHVSNLRDLGALLVTKIGSAGQGVTEIQFEVGEKAVDDAVHRGTLAAEAAQQLGTSLPELLTTVRNLQASEAALRERVKALGRLAVSSLPVESRGGFRITRGLLEAVETRDLLDEAAKRLAEPGAMVVLVNRGDNAFLFLGFYERLAAEKRLDARELVREALAPFGGKGGGKPNAAQGGAPQAADAEALLARAWSAVAARLGVS